MLDMLTLIALAALFSLAVLYTRACAALERPKGGR
jgi:hypothetical protein